MIIRCRERLSDPNITNDVLHIVLDNSIGRYGNCAKKSLCVTLKCNSCEIDDKIDFSQLIDSYKLSFSHIF